jgi:Kef-type K+ transport system membrane component KefB
MMVTASHIDLRQIAMVSNSRKAVGNVAIVAVGATGVAVLVGLVTGQPANIATYAVIMASSSAAVVLPVFVGAATSKSKDEQIGFARFVSQVAIADLLAIVVLPLAMGSSRIGVVAIGALVITAASALVYGLLRWAQSSGYWKRLRALSAKHGFGLELRLSFILLLTLVLIAQSFTVTIMIAGFGLGLAIAANGFPHRLAKQLFAVSEGFFSPIFFVLLGAGVDITAVFKTPSLLLLAAALGLGAIAVHLLPIALGLRPHYAVASAAQLGVPAAAVTIGLSQHSLNAGQAGAIMLAALITLAATAITVAAKKVS